MKNFFASLLALTTSLGALAASPTVEWQTLGNKVDTDGSPYHLERITVHSPGSISRLCFNRFARKMETTNPADTLAEIVPGYYYVASPRLLKSGGHDVVIELRMPWALENFNYEPDGFHAVMANGTVVPVSFTRQSLLGDRDNWRSPKRDVMPRGEDIYRFNESIAYHEVPGPYDIIPSFKSVRLTDGKLHNPAGARIVEQSVSDSRPDFYRISIGTDSILIEYTSLSSQKMARRVLEGKIVSRNPEGLPCAVIEDYPSLPYRAMMMDVARNYFNPSQIQQLVHLLANYRLNTLHFHPFDDEAWRVEIPGLPELTRVGARRGYTTDESSHLVQLFAGNGNPDTDNGTANGYFTRQEFIDFIRYCHSLGISVIPEIESPGHARAAIKSMQARAATTGDDSYLLSETTGDTSAYTSAQAFHDNIMNPGLPGPYRFMTKVIDELIAMYDEARVPLPGIHIGGDEVPAKAWDGSPAVAAMMARKGLKSQREVHAAFVDSLASILSSRGVKMFGWQEIAINHSDDYNRRIAPLTGGVNCWTNTTGATTSKALAAGFPVILSSVDKFYLDQCYNSHPMEQGLTWGGTVDEFVTLSGYPSEMAGVADAASDCGGRIIGISGHLFGETLRNFEQVQYLVLPKIFGMAERAWNTEETYSPAMFNSIIAENELPALARRGINFHLRQPGMIVKDDTVLMNSPYRNAQIRYTLDGTEPDESSTLYTGPVKLRDGDRPRARLFYLGKKSMTTFP